MVIGADIGGTFTDCAAVTSDGVVHQSKSLTTHENPVLGMIAGLEELAVGMGRSLGELLADASRVSHGTTIGTNAIIERQGARVGLIATRGHGDALAIMNGHGRVAGLAPDQVYDVQATDKPAPLVDSRLIVEVDERVDAQGQVVVELRDEQVRAAVRQLVTDGADSIAVCLLWSFLEPRHEVRVGQIIREEAPGIFVSLSSQVAPRLGEFERTVATVINGYIGPLSADYLSTAEDMLKDHGLNQPFLVMQANGGVVPASAAAETPLRTIDSGPVGGLAGSAALALKLGHTDVIATDMGGTSFDIGLIVDGVPLIADERVIDQYTYRLPHLDVRSIACGGGTIARYDPHTRSLRVGPESAGSDPGPACYGRGGRFATVTDADIVLGLLSPGGFLDGRMPLDAEAAKRAVSELAGQLGLGLEETAAGILQINSHRAAALIRRQTLERGIDTRDFALYAYGGAGPVHAFQYAPELGIDEVVIPLGNGASTLSAYGIAASDIVRYFETEVRIVGSVDREVLTDAVNQLEREAQKSLAEMGLDPAAASFECWALMRYAEQVMQMVPVALPTDPAEFGDALLDAFDREYTSLYGEGARAVFHDVEIVAVRLRATVALDPPAQQDAIEATTGVALEDDAKAPITGWRDVFWPDEKRRTATAIRDGKTLADGVSLEGPTLIELPHTTVAVAAGQRLERRGPNLVLHT